MRKLILTAAIMLISAIAGHAEGAGSPVIEVTGSATMNIIPNRITIEIGMEEYYTHKASGDSTLVRLSDIENDVLLSHIVVSDLGNYRNRDMSSTFLMAKRLSATVDDFNRIERISDLLDRKGIVCFNITKIDNSNMEQYNCQGLRAALDAARQKAEFIAENEGVKLLMPYEIVETTNEPSMYSTFGNVAYDTGSGIESIRRIVRRYSVKVRYLFQ